jgi:hypothetical protein
MGYFDGKCQLFEAKCKKQEIRLVPGTKYKVPSTKYQVSRALPVAGRLCENEKLKKKYLARKAAKPQRPPEVI